MTDDDAPGWFRALVESTPDVYFRYRLIAPRRFEYLSPSVEALCGHPASAFHDDPALCLTIVPREERRVLRQVLRASRGLTLTLHVRRGRSAVPVELRTVAVVQQRRVVAVEGVVRALELPLFATGPAPLTEPVQQRLVALIGEVHALLHRLPPKPAANTLRVGDLVFDPDRLTVTDQGAPVSLTGRELLVLRHLLLRRGRVISRAQILDAVWEPGFEGGERTVDVHVSRLRRKLPSLRP
ncbi:MAG: response regulator transcription factor, partial [Vicinamibacterales bacterium]